MARNPYPQQHSTLLLSFFRIRDRRDGKGSRLYIYYEFNFLKKQRTHVHFMASLFPELDLRCYVRFMYEATSLSDLSLIKDRSGFC